MPCLRGRGGRDRLRGAFARRSGARDPRPCNARSRTGSGCGNGIPKGCRMARNIAAHRHPGMAAARVRVRCRIEERLRVRVLRRVEDETGRSCLDDASQVHDGDAIGDVANDGELMRDKNHRQVEFPEKLCQQVEDLRLNGDVERRYGLICDENARARRKRTRDRDPLPLAAGKLTRVALGRARRQPDELEHRFHVLSCRRALDDAVDQRGLRDRAADLHARVERREGILEHHLHLPANGLELGAREPCDVDPVEDDRALVRIEESEDRARRWSYPIPTRRPGPASRPWRRRRTHRRRRQRAGLSETTCARPRSGGRETS